MELCPVRRRFDAYLQTVILGTHAHAADPSAGAGDRLQVQEVAGAFDQQGQLDPSGIDFPASFQVRDLPLQVLDLSGRLRLREADAVHAGLDRGLKVFDEMGRVVVHAHENLGAAT